MRSFLVHLSAFVMASLCVTSPLFAGPSFVAGDTTFTADCLRTYCQACHGLGEMRFIHGDDDETLWSFLLNNRAPRSGKLWIDGIIEVLDWPDGQMPPFDRLLEPPSRDWMPKGIKRVEMSQSVVEGVPAQRVMLSTLREVRAVVLKDSASLPSED